MTEFMGELICELAPVSAPRREKDRERVFHGGTIEGNRTVVRVKSSPDHEIAFRRLSEQSGEMAGDIRQQRFNVRKKGVSPIAVDYRDIHINDRGFINDREFISCPQREVFNADL